MTGDGLVTGGSKIWTVRGIPPDLQTQVSAAAKAARQTLGEWTAAALTTALSGTDREEMAKGVRQSVEQMKAAGLDPGFLLFFMWTESLKHFAEQGKGNVIFLDGSTEGMQRQMREMMAMNQLNTLPKAPPPPIPRPPPRTETPG